MKTAFLDADILLHRAVSFCDDEFDGEEVGDWKQALYFFDHILDNWLKEIGKVKDYYLVLSVGGNFRKEFYPEYKANRKDIKPHPAFRELKNEVMERVGSIWEEGIEADDLIGIRCTEDPNTLAVSADKDFATVPCTLYIPNSHGKKHGPPRKYSVEEADHNWLIQSMTGDTIDNYKGIPGIGPKKALEVLPHPEPVEIMWSKVRAAFESKGLSYEDALTMARLARILRAGEYDFEKKEVKLWTPATQ